VEREVAGLRGLAKSLELIAEGAEGGLNEADRVAYRHLERVVGSLKSTIRSLRESAENKEIGAS
jgi:hypothetical protein